MKSEIQDLCDQKWEAAKTRLEGLGYKISEMDPGTQDFLRLIFSVGFGEGGAVGAERMADHVAQGLAGLGK